jgi:amino-acid N-acetyltransferase
MTVDRPRVSDANSMHRLISHFAHKAEVLPRALSEIYADIRDYFVVRKRGRVINCAALHVTWVDLAEIRSLAVDEQAQNQRIGFVLVQACLEQAQELGIPRAFCLIRKPVFLKDMPSNQSTRKSCPTRYGRNVIAVPSFPTVMR